ncbi:hypothetical protein L6452_32025 [Arctium lappa]|uniref:Uncharacterized protein n=1 Tax=Arctium lappa TaxID=4217 RepID=A0ACB8Z4P7_ARCLA|nr:hypothetical protein L6452_32025 [Arctium lappa]
MLRQVLCIWNNNGWEKRKSRSIQSPPGHPSSLVGETKVQFHINQRHLLVVHESQIAIYDDQLECLRLWSPRESLSAPISSAVYSCECLLIFTGFLDGAVGVFDANSLRLRCRIAPSAYISPSISSSNTNAYPVDIAAHPLYVNQFALGLSDGSVHVIEPAAGEITWGVSEPQEDGSSASFNSADSAFNSEPSELPSRKRCRKKKRHPFEKSPLVTVGTDVAKGKGTHLKSHLCQLGQMSQKEKATL